LIGRKGDIFRLFLIFRSKTPYASINDFAIKEEFECAFDRARQGRIIFFGTQSCEERGLKFLADASFITIASACCRTVILAIDYNGADRREAAEDDRLIDGLWAELLMSAELLLFPMACKKLASKIWHQKFVVL